MEWKQVKLGEVLNFRRGHDLPHEQMAGGDIPVAGSNGIIGYHNIATPISPILTIGRSGNVGTPYLYKQAWAHNTTLYVDDFKGNDPTFLYYLCKTIPFSAFGGGSAVPTLNRNHIHPLEVLFPISIETQRRIAAILSSLDAQIENNNRINRNLEAQAQALFKSWFVDFDPWGGVMPEDWREGKLGEIISQETKKVGMRTNITVLSPITTGRLVLSEEFFTKQVYSASLAKYKVVEIGSFAYNPARVNIGSMGRNEFDFIGCVSPVYVVFRCLIGYENYFDLLRKTDDFKTEINLRAIGGVRQSLNYEDLARIEIIIPSQSAVERFNTMYDQLKLLIRNNTEANARLASLRDTLLPKLMKGEIEV